MIIKNRIWLELELLDTKIDGDLAYTVYSQDNKRYTRDSCAGLLYIQELRAKRIIINIS